MSKLKLLILLATLLLMVAVSQASEGLINQTDNVPITVTAGAQHSGDDKSGSMLAYINGHTLTIAFTENLGEVSIEVQNGDGIPVDLSIMDTPTGFMTYIPLAGRYTLIIKLEDGDEYFGEFEVED